MTNAPPRAPACILASPRLRGTVGVSLMSWLLLCAAVASAQSDAGSPTRSELEARANAAVARAATAGGRDRRVRQAEADELLRRLRDGDLQVGDRLVLGVPGVVALNDTFVVHAGRVVELPQIPPVSVAGVLRSELEHHMRVQLSRYVHDTVVVRARALMRIGVVGEVKHPGYYAVAPDALVGDALMLAGGLSATADAERIFVRRGRGEVWTAKALRDAVVEGRTLDRLDLRPGDEVVVAARRNWGEYVRTGVLAAGVYVSYRLATRR